MEAIGCWRDDMKVGTWVVVLVVAIGSVKLFFSKNNYLLFDNIYLVRKIKRSLISIS